MSERHALVAGATGIVGRRIAEHLSASGWRVSGLCRNPPEVALPYTLLAGDLTALTSCRAAAEHLRDVTHIYYAARYDHPEGVTESVDVNSAMLRNLVDAIEAMAPDLRHIHLVFGTKYYGHMAGPVPVPLTEDLPRGLATPYYFEQEDFIRERQRGARWSYSTSRPHTFVDGSADEPRNVALLIAVYATLARALEVPLAYPGSEKSYTVRTQFTYVPLLARGVVWMSQEPRCANEAYHVVNGDTPRWAELWPRFAEYFGVECGTPRSIRLAEWVSDKEALWQTLVERHSLERAPLASRVLWPYADYVFAPEWDIISSMAKARRDGFTESVESAAMFIDLFDRFRRDKIVP